MSRLLGIDLGERRVGIALAEGDGAPARPLTTLRRASRHRRRRGGVARRWSTPIASRSWSSACRSRSPARRARRPSSPGPGRARSPRIVGLPLTFRDERLTSHLAEDRLGPMKRGRSGGPPTQIQRDAYRARVDREAAAIILQDELDRRAGPRLRPCPAPATRRRPAHDDPLRRTPTRWPRTARPPVRSGRLCDRYPPAGTSSPTAGAAATGVVGRAAAARRHHQVPGVRAVLAGIVLVVALTALRPLVNSAILSWAADNPAALSMPFVSDIVREDLGDSLTTAGLERPDAGRVRRVRTATRPRRSGPDSSSRASSATTEPSCSSRWSAVSRARCSRAPSCSARTWRRMTWRPPSSTRRTFPTLSIGFGLASDSSRSRPSSRPCRC